MSIACGTKLSSSVYLCKQLLLLASPSVQCKGYFNAWGFLLFCITRWSCMSFIFLYINSIFKLFWFLIAVYVTADSPFYSLFNMSKFYFCNHWLPFDDIHLQTNDDNYAFALTFLCDYCTRHMAKDKILCTSVLWNDFYWV